MAPQQSRDSGISAHFTSTKPAKLPHSPNQKTGPKPDAPIPGNVAAKLRSYRKAHNEVESRVYALEQIAQPYEQFSRDTRQGISLMRKARAEILAKRQSALEEIESAVSEVEERLKEVSEGGVGEMSTERLTRVLIGRLEDGDVVKDEIGGVLAGLLMRSVVDRCGVGREVERSREDGREGRVMPTPPDDGDGEVGEREDGSEPLKKRKRWMNGMPQKRMSTRSQPVSETSSEPNEDGSSAPDETEEPKPKRSRTINSSQESLDAFARQASEPSTPEVAGEAAPRRSGRKPHPTKRQRDFVTWREIKASQEGKRR